MNKKQICYTILLFYLTTWFILLISSVIKKELILLDRTLACLTLIFVVYLNSKSKISPLGAILSGLIFVPHEVGMLGLYGSNILNYNYDIILHSMNGFLGSIIVSGILYSNKSIKNIRLLLMLSFIIIVFLGTVVEVGEYLGYTVFGKGDGMFAFGEGDGMESQGPWADSSTDQIANICGAFVGTLIYYLMILLKLKFKKAS